jgi:signal transduction histidine kinase/FixJ family two-component response regulator
MQMVFEARKSFRLRTYVVVLIVVTLAPVTIFGISLGLLDPIRERTAVLGRMTDTARALSLAMDRQVGISIAGLQALATSPQFRAGDFAAFRHQVDDFLVTLGGWILVVDENGQQHLNTVLPPDAPLPRTANQELLRNVFSARDVYVSDAVMGTLLKRLIVTISLRVPRPTGNLVLSRMIAPEMLTHLLEEQGLPQGWIGIVADRNGIILGRTLSPELIGEPMIVRLSGLGGVTTAITHEGTPVYVAWTTSRLSGWVTGVAVPQSVINAKPNERFALIAAAGFAAFILAITFAVLSSRRVIRPLASLAQIVTRSETPDDRLLSSLTGVAELDTLALAFRVKFAELTAVGAARERAQQELQELNQRLEERVREEVAAREAAQTRAAHAERMQAVGQLAGGIAHDINNVLQAVTGGAALIERRPEEIAKVQQFARMILDAGQRGASVTQRLLAFARRSDLRAEPIDVEQLFSGLHELLAHSLGMAIIIKLSISDERLKLVADRPQLETVLVNLVTNSRDAMPGGGTITFCFFREVVAPGSHHVAGLRPGSYVASVVADTGVGMDQTTLSRASEPFFTTKGRGTGTGLGLAMARGFAEQSGGGLHIESVQHQGTVVTIWLPEATTDLDDVNEASSDQPIEIRAESRVLLVDDDALVRESIALQLGASGYKVVAACSGFDALATLDAGERFDCMVTDLSMPNMDGLTLIRLAHQRRPHLPTVLLTGYATDITGLAIGGAISGTFTLLRKPILGKELADRLASLIAAHAEGGRSATRGHGLRPSSDESDSSR